MGAAVRIAVLVGVGSLALAACSNNDKAANEVADQLPDLTSVGLTEFTCGEGDAIAGSFQAPEDPYVAECWKGSPDKTFLDVANSAQDAVILATGGVNVTSDVCPEDSLSAAGGIACRAALVGEGESGVIVRTVVVLADPETALVNLPESPTQEQINESITGAAVEVLVGTEPAIQETADSSPSASS